MNAWCAEWGSRIKFFFSELYFRTWCGNSGRIAADFYLHPSEIPDAFMVLHCAVLLLAGVIALNYFLTQQHSQGVNIFMHIYNPIYQLNTESCIHCSSSHQVCIKIYPNPDSRAFSFQLPLHVFHFYMLCHIFNIATNTRTTSGSPGLLRRQISKFQDLIMKCM